MKRTILLVMMMLPIMAMAQLPHFAKLGEKYNGMEGVKATTINKQMISMFGSSYDGLDFVDEIQILLCEDTGVAKSIIKDVKKAVKKSDINELLSANEDGATFTVYTKSDGDIFTDIVVVVENEDPSGFIVISGDIPQDKISEIVKIANM